jgi:hypothetical protein
MLPTISYLDLSGAKPAPPDMPGRPAARQGIPESALRAIAELKDLKVLKLGYSAIGAEGLRILGTVAAIEKLGLEGCPRVNDDALMELAKWKNLKYLDVQDTEVTQTGVEALKKANPSIAILSGGI